MNMMTTMTTMTTMTMTMILITGLVGYHETWSWVQASSFYLRDRFDVRIYVGCIAPCCFSSKVCHRPTVLSCCGSFGGLVEDIITTYFCHCCSLAQMARHAWPDQTSCDICSEPEVVDDVSLREGETVIEAIVV